MPKSAYRRRQALRRTAQDVARDARRYPPAQRVHLTERCWLPEAAKMPNVPSDLQLRSL
jgi:hypothetical protein